ncbi:hypothetical protein Tco_1356704 [Tanacetum coccineum]
MATLKFASSHNMVAFLDKPTESDGFEQIVKTINEEVYIQALVDKKKVIVTETSVRSDLQLEDTEAFFSPQWKFLIHTIIQCLSAKTTAWNEFSNTMTSAVICLATNQKFNFSKYIFDNMMKNLEGGFKFLMYPRLSQRVLALETTKTNQALKIDSLKRRVKKLEKKKGSRTHRLRRVYKDDASKQGRKIDEIDQDAEEVEVEKVVSTAEVTTVSATTTIVDELTLA